jgi:hypothetical protein
MKCQRTITSAIWSVTSKRLQCAAFHRRSETENKLPSPDVNPQQAGCLLRPPYVNTAAICCFDNISNQNHVHRPSVVREWQCYSFVFNVASVSLGEPIPTKVNVTLSNHLFRLPEDLYIDVVEVDFIEKLASGVLAIGSSQTCSEQPETKPGRVASDIDQSNSREKRDELRWGNRRSRWRDQGAFL